MCFLSEINIVDVDTVLLRSMHEVVGLEIETTVAEEAAIVAGVLGHVSKSFPLSPPFDRWKSYLCWFQNGLDHLLRRCHCDFIADTKCRIIARNRFQYEILKKCFKIIELSTNCLKISENLHETSFYEYKEIVLFGFLIFWRFLGPNVLKNIFLETKHGGKMGVKWV